ncbi:MAG: hypothetical protein NVSMB23_18550 [Myxococcales bacterium]
MARQAVPQSIPPGLEVTRPFPSPERATSSLCCGPGCGTNFWNVADTALSAASATEQTPVPLQAPVHPENDQPASAIASKDTLVPASNSPEQAAPQSIPAGAERTVPAPDFDTLKAFLPGAGGPASVPEPAS